jgi:hypothetical protein
MIDAQTFKEVLGAVFFACLADCDAATACNAADILEGAIETGAVQDDAAKEVLHSIVRAARVAKRLT